MGDSDSSSSNSSSEDEEKTVGFSIRKRHGLKKKLGQSKRGRTRSLEERLDLDGVGAKEGQVKDKTTDSTMVVEEVRKEEDRKKARASIGMASVPLEQRMPADAVLAKEGADEVNMSCLLYRAARRLIKALVPSEL